MVALRVDEESPVGDDGAESAFAKRVLTHDAYRRGGCCLRIIHTLRL